MDKREFDQIVIKAFRFPASDGKDVVLEEVEERSGVTLRIVRDGVTTESVRLSRDVFAAISDARYRMDWENPEKAARVLSSDPTHVEPL